MEREHEPESTSALLAALYDDGSGEVPPELGEELAAYQSLRSLFADLPEEEPPSDLNAKLIRAAAGAASPSKESGPSLWERVLGWFEPLRANPALTALASLVLVASIGGVLYVGGKAKTDPTVPGAASNTPALVGDQPAADTTGVKDGDKLETKASLESRDPSPTEAAAVVDGKDVAAKVSKPKPKKNLKRAPRRPSEEADLEADVSQTIILDSPNTEKGKTQPSGAGSVGGESTPEPAPPPPPTRGVSPSNAKELASLRKKAQGYAKSGDCTSVRKLGKQVRDIDDGYYDRSFLGDAQIAACYRVKK